MDIRTKLIFALVSVSLASMFALSAAVEPRVSGFLTDATVQRLEELADAKARMLGLVVDGWKQRTESMASSPRLRATLEALEAMTDVGVDPGLRDVLTESLRSDASVFALRVFGVSGDLLAGVVREEPAGAGSGASGAAMGTLRPIAEAAGEREAAYLGVEWSSARSPRVVFASPVPIEGGSLGTLVAVFEVPEIRELIGDGTEVGTTGESLVFALDPDSVPHTLHPTRHHPEAEAGLPLQAHSDGLAAGALSFGSGSDSQRGDAVTTVDAGPTDYRGERVWAATRAVQETGWGLIVKVDAREEEETRAEFRSWLRRTALVLAAFAILAGFMLGLRFALPVHALAEAANEIRSGDLSARAKVVREDEVGLLTRTFNEMAEALEDRVGILHEFRKFFDVSIDLMCIASTDGYFKRVNPAFVRVLGWTEEELLARPFLDFVHGDDVAKTEREVAQLVGGIPTISFENRFVCRDGTYRCLRWTSFPDQGVLYAIARVIDESASA